MNQEQAVKVWKPLYVHFTSSYNVFESGGIIKYGKTELEDKGRQLIKFSKLFDKDIEGSFFLIANFIENNFEVPWNIDQNSIDIYLKWKGRRESISYIFNNDMQFVSQNLSDKDFLTVYPHESNLFKNYLNRKITPESIILLDKYYIPFLDKWCLKSQSNLMHPRAFLLLKYKKFVKHDELKIKSIIDKWR